MRLNALAVTAGFAVMFASAYPAVNGEAVIIAPEAHGFLHARQGVEIYDLTAGFSLNKDHHQMLFVDKDRIFSGELEEGINRTAAGVPFLRNRGGFESGSRRREDLQIKKLRPSGRKVITKTFS